MATFSCTVRANGTNKATVTASLQDAGAFGRRRWVYIEFTSGDEYYFLGQTSDGGVNTTFSGTITDLQPGTHYYWTAEIAYEQPAGAVPPNVPISSDFLDWGDFWTDEDTPTSQGVRIFIGNGEGWDEYRAYIGNGSGWDAVTPYIGDGTDWE